MATKYVSTSGTDGAAGDIGTPWRTISYGTAHTAAGSTLLVRGGTYAEFVDYPSMVTGTDWTTGSGAVYVSNYNGEVVWVQPSSGIHAVRFQAGINYHIWNGIGIDAINLTSPTGPALMQNGVTHVRWQNAQIKNAYWTGVGPSNSSGACDYLEYINVIVSDGGRAGAFADAAHGFYFGGSSNVDHHILVDGCEVYGFTAKSNDSGLQVYSGDPSNRALGITVRNTKLHGNSIGSFIDNTQSGVAFYNNQVYANTYSGIIVYYDTDGFTIYNNTIDANGEWGIELGTGGASTNNLIKNNAITNNTNGPIVVWSTDSSSKATIQYNLLNGNGNSNLVRDDNSLSSQSSNITSAPGYVNQASRNYQLAVGSALINAGTTLASVTTDFVGLPRPQGTAYCIGAYEFPASTSPPAVLYGSFFPIL